MKKLKQLVKKMIGNKLLQKKHYVFSHFSGINKIIMMFKIKMNNSYISLVENIKLNKKYNTFYYNIDKNVMLYLNSSDLMIENLCLDYELILNNSLNDLKIKVKGNDAFCKKEIEVIESLEIYIDRITMEVKLDDDIKNSILGIKNRHANSFKDALQRILFLNQFMWQTGHKLNGLGRLDLILDKYYDKNEKENNKKLINSFLEVLHEDYYFKSSSLAGDTGQIIELCGYTKKDKYFVNDLSYLLIECIMELQYPDPKVFLRVSKDTPKDLIDLSLKCIQIGIGCPLFANDDVIIEKLINFGYDKKDAYNYATSACWEPFIPGKSFDQNNIESLVFVKPLVELFEKEEIDNIMSFDILLKKLFYYNEIYINEFLDNIEKLNYQEDPLLSLFTEDCIKNKTDISIGGAKYNNYGFTGVGLSNLINSLLFINKLVFEDKTITLEEYNNSRKNNYNGCEDLVLKIRSITSRFGTDDRNVIELTNKIIRNYSNIISKRLNPLGSKYKFGLSAPSYIIASKNFEATFDGRRKREPFGVHISCDKLNGYTELINFASELDYNDNRFNGNVIDFFVTPSFIKDNFESFSNFIILSIKRGFFEMQMNVVSSKTLIEARKHPNKFPNLIVRVWGFSAYFKDLPNEYKDYIIERAIKSESNC